MISGRGSSAISSASFSIDLPLAPAVSRAGTATSRVTSRSPARALAAARRGRAPAACGRWRCPAGHLERDVAVERGHGQRRPERRLGEGDRHGQRQVVALAAEQRVLARRGRRRTGRRPGRRAVPGAPLPASRMRWPSLTPGRDADGDRAGLGGDAAAARRSGTGRRPPEPVPRQFAARLGEGERALAAAGHAGALQTGQVCGRGAGPRAAAGQVGQVPGLCMRSGTVTPRTASSKESVASVSTSCPRAGPDAAWLRPRAVPRRRPAAEQAAEEVAEAAAPPARRRRAAGLRRTGRRGRRSGRRPGSRRREAAAPEAAGPAPAPNRRPGVVVLGAPLGRRTARRRPRRPP